MIHFCSFPFWKFEERVLVLGGRTWFVKSSWNDLGTKNKLWLIFCMCTRRILGINSRTLKFAPLTRSMAYISSIMETTCVLMDWIITPMVWIWTITQTQLQMVFLLTQFEAWYWLWRSCFWEKLLSEDFIKPVSRIQSPQPVDWSFPLIQAPLQGLGHDTTTFFFLRSMRSLCYSKAALDLKPLAIFWHNFQLQAPFLTGHGPYMYLVWRKSLMPWTTVSHLRWVLGGEALLLELSLPLQFIPLRKTWALQSASPVQGNQLTPFSLRLSVEPSKDQHLQSSITEW